MRTKLILLVSMILALGLPGMAAACYYSADLESEAGCFGWEATTYVYFGGVDENARIVYEVTLVKEGETEGITHSGEYVIPFEAGTTVASPFSGTWEDLCGTYTATGTFQLIKLAGYLVDTQTFNTTFTCECEEGGCWRTPGYWKNHKRDEAWNDPGLMIGGSPYSYAGIDELVDILKMSVKGGDASIILAHHLIAAKLNVIAGNTGIAELDAAIAEGDAIIAQFGVGLGMLVNEYYPVERGQALAVKDILEYYNELGCDDEDDEKEEEEEFEDKALESEPEQSTWSSLKSMYR